MIAVSNAKWDFSKEEKYAIKWLEENGYEGKIVKQYISKTVFEICKDGIADKFELTQGVKTMNIGKYMEQFAKNWQMLCKLNAMKKEKNNA